jgi:excisionase family DNA binding protein
VRRPGLEVGWDDGGARSRFLTVAEVAQRMRVSKMTVYRQIKSGALEAVRVGKSFRIPEAGVDRYLAERWR